MSRDVVVDKVRRFIVEQFPSARGRSLGSDERLLQNGVIDSLGILSLVGYLQQEFRIAVDDEDLVPEHFETLGGIAAFVTDKLAVTSEERA